MTSAKASRTNLTRRFVSLGAGMTF